MPDFEQRQGLTQNSHRVGAAKPDRATRQPVHAALPTQDWQHLLGNQTVQRFARSCPVGLPSPSLCPYGGACHTCPAPVQAKLTINKPGDKYEQEADRVAEQVMCMPEPRVQRACPTCDEERTVQTKSLAAQITPLVQRQTEPEEEEEPIQTKLAGGAQVQRQAHEEEEEERVQTKRADGHTPQAGQSLGARIGSLKGGGQPLSPSTRSLFEPRFGCDFGQVRVHTDANAAKSTEAVNAQAFTIGKDIVFGSGQYAPETKRGQRLLCHELTHVLQQTKRPTASARIGSDKGGVSVNSGLGSSTQQIQLKRRYRDCTPAITGIQNAPVLLDSARKLAKDCCDAAIGGLGRGSGIATALRTHFRLSAPTWSQRKNLQKTFMGIRRFVNNRRSFICNSTRACRSTWHAFYLPADKLIHLCPRYWRRSTNRGCRAITLIHEAAHKFGVDVGGTHRPQRCDTRYPGANVSEALDNADAHAFFAYHLYLGQGVRSNICCRVLPYIFRGVTITPSGWRTR